MSALVEVVARTRNLFLEFDGPICSVFAGYPAPKIADELRRVVVEDGHELTTEMRETTDPVQVLRLAGDLDDLLAHRVADALRNAELVAATSAEPTPGVDDVIEAALDGGRRLAVVSNNSGEAVPAYLRRVGLLQHFVGVVGRYDGMPPARMKPNNHLIGLCLMGTGSAIELTALVGDTVPDIKAARSLFMASIGYANEPGKSESLADAGADAVITEMVVLADAVASTPLRI